MPGVRKLDELVFYEGPGHRLEVVRYYEEAPLHYSGEIYSVQCQSPATRNLEAHSTQDADWLRLERGGAIGTKRAADLLPRFEGRHIPIGEGRVVWLGPALQVSFDACGSFAWWDPVSLAPELVDPVVKPDYCAPKGSGDCRRMDFEGDRAPRYDEIRVERSGRIRFVARTPAFRNTMALLVTSDDFGLTWKVEPTGGKRSEPSPEAGSAPAGSFRSIREMDIGRLVETRLEDVRPAAAELEEQCGEHEKLVAVANLQYGDLDSDGQEEALFQGHSCLAGNAGIDTFGVLKLERTGKLRDLEIVEPSEPFRARDPRAGLRGHVWLTIENGRLVESFPVYRGEECEACASGGRRRLIEWDDHCASGGRASRSATERWLHSRPPRCFAHGPRRDL
jgi:hypothetical protein